MYQLYKAEMEAKGDSKAASEFRYRQIFNTEYNLSFHHPKKDQSDDCAVYYALTSKVTFNV